jgi:outer membrane translocation and assembly module TamA
LTSHRPSVFFFRITEDQLQFTPDMKKLFVLTMLISLAMICSCQKQDSAAAQQVAQRKTDLDAREEALAERKSALDEREKALDEREEALAEKEKATMNARTNPTDVQGQIPDAAQVQAERDTMIQQLPPEMNPGPSQLNAAKAAKAEKEAEMQQQLARRQPRPEELQSEKQRKLGTLGMSGGAVFPSAAATSPTPSPAVEATSPSPSPTVEVTSPTP